MLEIINMGTYKKDHISDTQFRIMEAAGEVFSEHGYAKATIREICRRAGVNIAAVNYYFGDKARLYLSTVRFWKGVAFEKYPHELESEKTAPPEARLETFIRSILYRILEYGKASWFGKLIAREYFEPTEAIDILIDEIIRPMYMYLFGIVKGILGEDVDERTIRKCCESIVSQCNFFLHAKPIVLKMFPDVSFDREQIELLANHITTFSLNALHAMRKEGEGAKQ